MMPTVDSSNLGQRGRARWFAFAAACAALTALALTACGPRDASAVAGATPAATTAPVVDASRVGTPVPPAAAVAPAPAYAPPPVTVAETPPQLATAQPSGDAAAPVVAPVPRARVDDQPPARSSSVPVRNARVAQAPAPSGHLGSIESIEPIRQRPQGTGAGAVVGGVLGGVVGHQFGGGLGQAAMTGLGAAGGAIAGNNVERNVRTQVVGYRIHVRLDNGRVRTYERKQIGNLHVGDRVRVDEHGLRRA